MILAVVGIVVGLVGLLLAVGIYRRQKRDLRARERRVEKKQRKAELKAAKRRIAELVAELKRNQQS